MLKFRPISYNEGDFKAVKYIGTSSALEGYLCWVKRQTLNDIQATLYTGTTNIGATTNTTMNTVLAKAGQIFPIYREDPDPENVGATITRNQYCIAFFGKEWEVHKSATTSGYATTWSAVGNLVVVGSTGKFSKASGKYATKLIIAECTGTYNGWIRMRSLLN